MLFQVVQAATTFFILYVIILFAFASSFAIMTPAGDKFSHQLNEVFLLGTGDYVDRDWAAGESDEKITPYMMHAFFILAIVIVHIVMLNILIALVSDAYTKVNETQQQANDFERAVLINETA